MREIIQLGHFGAAYEAQSSAGAPEDISVPQIVLLKLLDGYIHSAIQADVSVDPSMLQTLVPALVHIQRDLATKLSRLSGHELDSAILAHQLQGSVLVMHVLSQVGTADLEARRSAVSALSSSTGASRICLSALSI